jgi:FeS assembly SUF system regulator
MIRISRLTDYGIVLMSHIATHGGRVHNAAEVASEVHLLAKEGLLESRRGVKGGYGLVRRPHDISLGQIIKALEGPIAITACTNEHPGDCEHEPICPVRGHWRLINLAIRQALDSITLADMAARPRPIVFPTVGAGAPPLPCAPVASD